MLSFLKKKKPDLTFPEIPENNTFVIGDIHGCLDQLKELLGLLPLNSKSLLIFLGDYIDRGPDPKGVVSFLLELRKQYSCFFLMGNHEQLLLDFIDHHRLNTWLSNGAKQTLDSYGLLDNQLQVPNDHVHFFRHCEYFFETEQFLFVHGGIPANLTIRQGLERSKHHLIWERDHLDAEKYKWEKTVVCGHTPVKNPILKDKLIAIDTGCVYGLHNGYGKLTAIQLPSRTIYQVENKG